MAKTEKKKLYIIDISSFIFRAYYAIRPLSSKDGTPVNAVYGVVSMVRKLMETHKPDHVVVCNDTAGPGFRNDIFPEYKANRGAPPEDLIPQFDLIKEFIQTYPILAFEKKGFEADDLIATLVETYKDKEDFEIYIVSSDKDLMQLIQDNVFLFDTMKNKISGAKEVEEKFGVGPDKVVDVQALSGDSVDNIPGIAGVGPKTAAKLVNEYGSVEEVLANADNIKGKLGEKVASGKEDALVSKKLVSLDRNVDIKLTWDDFELQKPNVDDLNAFFERLNFTKFKIEGGNSSAFVAKQRKIDFITIDSEQKLKGIASNIKVKKPKLLAFDTETDSIDSLNCNLVGLSFCYNPKTAYYIPLGHKEGPNLSLDLIKEYLGSTFTDPSIQKVAQNAKFDLNVLSQYDFDVSPVKEDTLVASYLVDPVGKHSLDYLSGKYLGYQMIAYSDVVQKGETFADVPVDKATNYAAEDAWAALELQKEIQPDLESASLTTIYHEIEIPLLSVLARMEQHGIAVNTKLLKDLEKEFSARLETLEKKIYTLAGEEFNINSTKQLAVILFEKLKLPVIKKTKTGYSTDVNVLTELAAEHELPAKLLEYRSIAKLLSTYVISLSNLINPKTNRIHTSFNQTIAATGRLSSTEPNLQNIPIKTEEGKRIREIFIAPEGSVLLSADYSQIELRLLAAFSKDDALVNAYHHDIDIHAQTASKILGLPLDEVDSATRGIGKTINFGVIYGQSPFGLSKQLGVPQSEAKEFIEGFYREFASVRDYKEELLEKARADGFVTTYLGRRRYLTDLNSKNKLAKQNAERVAFNTVFQGSAADLIKKAMISIDHYLREQTLKTKMLLQVHDELVFEIPKSELEIIRAEIPKIMESAFELDVPLKVSCDWGVNWAEAH